jgi:hypothetical protein
LKGHLNAIKPHTSILTDEHRVKWRDGQSEELTRHTDKGRDGLTDIIADEKTDRWTY